MSQKTDNSMLHADLYGTSLALLVDLYELTMAEGYWKAGLAEREAVFQLFFRKKPFEGPFAIAAGLQTAIELLERFQFDASDLAYLESLKAGGQPLFEKRFVDYLSKLKLKCDIDAVPEGTVVFPHEPILRVIGPILEAQMLETMLLNIINFQSLIATKAARICHAAGSDEVVEFGVRRAQGIDGALSASRAAYIGGCPSTSHVLAGKFFGIPVKGTMAHSWVMAFEDEEEAFMTFAHVMPKNCILLVDTYDSIKGVHKSIKVAKKLEKEGISLLGVRLDSGDMAQLSVEIRKILDEAGLKKTKIMASNELDEFLIRDIKQQGSTVTIWGVGTNLVTAKGQPALDGIYKLTGIKDKKGDWQYKLKLSEQLSKATNPGITQVRRFFHKNECWGDMLYDEKIPISDSMVDLTDNTTQKKVEKALEFTDLLVPIFRKGKKVYTSPSIKEIQTNTRKNLEKFPQTMRRFLNPSPYFIGMEKNLFDKKMLMVKELQAQI